MYLEKEVNRMYKRFNLLMNNNDKQYSNSILPYYDDGLEYLSDLKEVVSHNLALDDLILDSNDNISGDQIRDKWFPQLDFNIFLSHSHQDEKIAIALAGWLKHNFGLDAFIDSSVWGYCDELLQRLDNAYCRSGDYTYNYEKRNKTTSHVHIMLSSALTKMLDQTECVIFLNTDHSIPDYRVVSGTKVNNTYSPWIYHELLMSTTLEVKQPNRLTHGETRGTQYYNYERAITYNTEPYLKKMQELKSDDLIKWEEQNHGFHEYSLDTLYELVGNK